MEFRQELSQKQSQNLVLSQNLRQSLEILSLSNHELSERIQRELLENPILEVEERGELSSHSKSSDIQEKAALHLKTLKKRQGEELTRQRGKKESSLPSLSQAQGLEKTEQKDQLIQNTAQSKESLGEHLLSQLRLNSLLDERELLIGETIISALDKHGLLRSSLEELFPKAKQKEMEKILEVQKMIQHLDPLSCGSRTSREALLFQAHSYKADDERTQRILRDYFTELENLDFKKIERDSALSWEEIQKSLHFIQSLEPYPGRLYTQDAPEYILPDIIVQEGGGELYLTLNEDGMPSLKISEEYEKIFKNTKSSLKEKELRYIKDKLHSAQALIQNIERRKGTLFQTAQKILEYQKNFFLKGSQHLRPLTLETIARDIQVHNSTVSRTIANKYLQCRWGYFNLKYFFSAKLESISGSRDAIAAQDIKERLRFLIDKEEASSPLSDQDLLSLFKKEDIRIARRTIAKYRKMLNIPSAEKRQKIAMAKIKLRGSSFL